MARLVREFEHTTILRHANENKSKEEIGPKINTMIIFGVKKLLFCNENKNGFDAEKK